jgi:hypothetical protein
MPAAVAGILRQAAGDDLIDIAGDRFEEIYARLHAMAVTPPATEDKIFAVVSIRNGGIELLPHWLEHYTRLGVDEILLGVFDDLAAESVAQIERYAAEWKFRRFSQHWSGTSELEHYVQRQTGCRLAGARPGTWILHTDLDELHEYPAPLRQIAAAAAEKKIKAVHGQLVDRVAADGSLPAVRPRPSLWEQFPVSCNVTEGLADGVRQKVMLARYSVVVRSGHHEAFMEPVAPPPLGRPEEYRVAHFKWHGDLLSRLRWGVQQQIASQTWKTHAHRLLAWIDAHGGRIDLADPALQAVNTAKTL